MDVERLRVEYRRILLKIAGMSEKEIDRLNLNSMSIDEFVKLVKKVAVEKWG